MAVVAGKRNSNENSKKRLVPQDMSHGKLVFFEQIIEIVAGFYNSRFGFFPYGIAVNDLGFSIDEYFRAFAQIGNPDIIHVFVFANNNGGKVGRELKHSRTNCWAYFPFGYCISPLPPVEKRRTKSCLQSKHSTRCVLSTGG